LKCRTLSIALVSLAWALGAGVARAQAIEAGPLRPLTAWEAGVLDPGERPAPLRRWDNAAPEQLAAAFKGVPTVVISPAAWRLTLRTLSSPGAAPSGAPDDEAILVLRYETLGRLGAAERLAGMVRASGDARARSPLALYAAQAELANAAPDEACARARDPSDPTAEVLLVRAFCAALAKQTGPMDVAVDLARTAGAKDAFLFSALPVLSGLSSAKPEGRYDSSLHAYASLAAGLKPGRDPLKSASTLALATVARSEAAPAAMRYEAVERAVMRGALAERPAQAALQTVLQGQPARAKPPWLASALQEVGALETSTRTARIAELFAAESLVSRRSAIARLFRSDVLGEPRGGEPQSAIAPLIQAALLLGDVKAAQRWRARLARETPAQSRAHLDALLAAATGQGMAEAAAQRVASATGDEPRAARDVALLAALGAMPAAFQQFAATAPAAQRFDELALAALVEAAGRGASGEAALRAVALVAPGAAKFDVRGLTSLIQALRSSGFEEDARAIAVEAMLG